LAWRGCRGSSGETNGRLPRPSTRPQPSRLLRSWWCEHSRSRRSSTVKWLVAQSTRWSFSSQVPAAHPSAAHVGYSHSSAVCWVAVGLRPRWATPTTCSPLVTTAARKGSPVSSRSCTAETATGPEAGDLADLALDGSTPQQRLQVDPHDGLGPRTGAGRALGGQLGQGIGRVGLGDSWRPSARAARQSRSRTGSMAAMMAAPTSGVLAHAQIPGSLCIQVERRNRWAWMGGSRRRGGPK
jgi:hypothetical protein